MTNEELLKMFTDKELKLLKADIMKSGQNVNTLDFLNCLELAGFDTEKPDFWQIVLNYVILGTYDMMHSYEDRAKEDKDGSYSWCMIISSYRRQAEIITCFLHENGWIDYQPVFYPDYIKLRKKGDSKNECN